MFLSFLVGLKWAGLSQRKGDHVFQWTNQTLVGGLFDQSYLILLVCAQNSLNAEHFIILLLGNYLIAANGLFCL